MRTSVLTVIFACTLIFLASSSKAEAAQIDLSQIQELDSAVTQIIALAESPDGSQQFGGSEKNVVEVKQHTVTKGDTLESIATKYQTSWQRLFDKNTEIENPNLINEGELIVIPSDIEELVARELPISPVAQVSVKSSVSTTSSSVSPAGNSSGNGYVAGYCTWYVKSRRPDLPNNLGNAASWVSLAASQGIPTGSSPSVGAVAQRNNHVAYVESVNGDGTITISDMNYRNLYEKTVRTVPASEWQYIY